MLYIGPGAGFVVLGSFLTAIISLAATCLSFLIWPFRALWLAIRTKRGFSRALVNKVIVLGLDGLDPNLTEQFIAQGKMPTFARLQSAGSYSRLRTTFPALSPVAWSTFATGVNPAKHNVFDFLNRDLRTYLPYLSGAQVRPPRRVLRIGSLRLPLTRPVVESLRKSESFWSILSRHAIPSTILRVPVTFPPEHFNGRQLSAMSTPDLQGTQGTFSWFTTAAEQEKLDGGNRLVLSKAGGEWTGRLNGPASEQGAQLLDFHLRIDSPSAARLKIGHIEYRLTTREYTPWIRIRFGQSLSSVSGIARFLLISTDPVSLYVTPIQIDPERPALPISHPSFYAGYLAKLLGTFSTLGMAEDTWALNEGAIDEDAFLEQCRLIQNEREAMFFSALQHTRRGVVACVFDHTDRIQHMFFRYLRRGDDGKTHERASVIEKLYTDCDRVLAETLKYVDERTALLVLSDHGFRSFRWGVNINSWLLREGYLVLQPGSNTSGPYFEKVDWSNTRAYTFGLGGIYINVKGREKLGIVRPESKRALEQELIEKLSGLKNDFGELAIRNVYSAHDKYRGPYRDAAPDLIAGYADGHRASWDAAVGKVTDHVFDENQKAWSGDHCVDPSLVPGVFFTNWKLNAAEPGIEDMAPTILKLFGISPPNWMEGTPLFAVS